MDVDSFIAKYRPEWDFLERALSHGRRGLVRLSGEDIQRVLTTYERTSTHLAEARTRYSDPALRDYLNALVARAHAALYGVRPRTIRGFFSVFGGRYQEALGRTVPFVAISAAVLVVVTIATMLWVANSPEARAGLLPGFAQESVQRAGDTRIPTANGQLSTFILLNNLQVAFLAFAAGITLGVGTLYILVQNALLLGSLAGAFQAFGGAASFWSLILPHGLLELTAICITAGAGIRIGWSLVDPADRSRSRALAEEARDAVLVLVGVIPAFLVAAIIEGFLSGTSAPDWLELGVGVVVAVAYVWLLFGRARPVTNARTI